MEKPAQFCAETNNYALDVAQRRKSSKSSGLVAFLCSIVGGGFYEKANLTEYRFTRANFSKFVAENYAGEPNMDPAVFIAELQEPSQSAYKTIVGDLVWGRNWKKDTAAHVKLAELYRNAEKHCKSIELSERYCSFLAALSKFEANVAKRLSSEGEIE